MVFGVIALAAALQQDAAAQPALSCPIAGAPITGKPGEVIDYAGIRFSTCCTDCGGAFKKDPAKALKASAESGKTVGTFLFDPISGARIDAAKAAAYSDFKGVRYEFTTPGNKTAFDSNPKKYATMPAKEALFCPVYKTKIESYSKAGGYVDSNGVRYYVCCAHCLGEMGKDAAKYTANAADQVAVPAAADAPPAQ